ncbi:protein SODIUM POTASSIUM ROOT DEFECTIVE 3-like [Ananas comosus]|uniref:Protein SODIUM POTASSIUM ROOT DEFECTIVE 3-like n=1 Tax=Ananas comosus TaxID=4615 RepID=A0A6P5ESD0_ANACO|nr:protein SODIUM POTASSIUM ROOT DEFECTIVE 3-like [Ananas comosus]
MASLLRKDMKRVNFSCSSPASASTCSSITSPAVSSRALDRHTPHLRDSQRTKFHSSSKPIIKEKSQVKSKKALEEPIGLVSPADSSRYLLRSSRYRPDDKAFIDVLPDSLPAPELELVETSKFQSKREDEGVVLSSSSSTRPQDQVVVLRVSLHCKGCAGKVRKHISKMQGVTSFNIDLVAKKVTVIGDVTPLGVLNSISKVKNAQFWPSPPQSAVQI